MQNCSSCGVLLEENNAYKKTEKKWQSKCRSCYNEYCVERWQKRKLKAIEYKGGKCEECGYNKFYGALEFHHIDPSTKENTIATIKNRSWDNLKKELDKCVLLCSNCHKETHYKLNT